MFKIALVAIVSALVSWGVTQDYWNGKYNNLQKEYSLLNDQAQWEYERIKKDYESIKEETDEEYRIISLSLILSLAACTTVEKKPSVTINSSSPPLPESITSYEINTTSYSTRYNDSMTDYLQSLKNVMGIEND